MMRAETRAAPSPWIAIVLVVVLVTLGAVGAWFVVDRSAANAATERAAATASAAPTDTAKPAVEGPAATPEPDPDADVYESACGLKGGSLEPPMMAPATEWVAVGNGWKLPISRQYGPGEHDGDGAWTCFAHTPMGAVLAAYTVSMRVDGLADDYDDAVKRGTVADAGQQRALARGKTPASAEPAVARGFSIDRYESLGADVTFYLEIGGTPMTCGATVVWDPKRTDWQLQLRADGSTQGCSMVAPEAYIPWGPQE